MKLRSTGKYHIDSKKKSATIFIKKDFVEKIGISDKVELILEYDDETKTLTVTEL